VLDKCANPSCEAQFRYLHRGRVFEVEIQYSQNWCGEGNDRLPDGKGHVERIWLCDQCAIDIPPRDDGWRALLMETLLRHCGGKVTSAFAQSLSKPAGTVAKVWIRPFGLGSELSTSRRTYSFSNVCLSRNDERNRSGSDTAA